MIALVLGMAWGQADVTTDDPAGPYVDALKASRAYEANVSVMNVSRTMLNQSIELFA